MANSTVKSEFITKEAFDTLQKEVKALEESSRLKQKELLIGSTSISKADLKEIKAEIIMWIVGIMIAFGALIFIVLNQRVDDVNLRIDDVREDITENRAMIQKVLDKLNELDDKK